jgi:hypothetical protein
MISISIPGHFAVLRLTAFGGEICTTRPATRFAVRR